MSEPQQVEGWVDFEVGEEFPDLRLVTCELAARQNRRSPRGVRLRLATLSDRLSGPQAVNLRRRPVPAAYRVFFHHIGLDPDQTRTPIEAAIVERMLRGGFRSRNHLEDALLIALVETGVAVWALDAEKVWGPLGIRAAGEDERLGRGEEAPLIPEGQLVVADLQTPLAILFGDVAADHAVSGRTGRMILFAVQVAGVASLYVEEALWMCVEALAGGGRFSDW
jgi:DNA/RNA-binding domain of Phe-tRNA-synthetase-like protein